MAIANLLLDDEAVASFLDTTVTKFLDSTEDGIAVTKYLHDAFNDISVTKFMEAEEDGIAVTKYLSGAPSYNTYPGNTDVNKRNVNMTIIQFLEDYMHEHPEHMDHDAPNDISVTKFLQQNANVTQSQTQNGQKMNIIQFLQDNDISVTKFLDYMDNALDEQA